MRVTDRPPLPERSWGTGWRALALLLIMPASARADVIVFTTGRTMAVEATRAEGDRWSVTLRDGGEASFPASVVARIDPDEVPDPVADAEPLPDSIALPSNAAETASLSARPFAPIIASAAARHGVDLRLVHAVIETESNYEPRARSGKGAKGLMQLMPETARQYALRDPYDPEGNIEAGVRHLKGLLGRFDRDVGLALAAYNAGEAAVRRHGGLPPFAETTEYVRRILQRLGR